MDESFHILLPSNVSPGEFHENKIGHYTTILPTPLQLHGDWLVGLQSISYTYSWYNVVEGDYFYLLEVFPNLSDTQYKGRKLSDPIRIMQGHYESGLEIIREVETRMANTKWASVKDLPRLVVEAASNRIIIHYGKTETGSAITIAFSDELEKMLGLNETTHLMKPGIFSTDTIGTAVNLKSHSKRSIEDGDDTPLKRSRRQVTQLDDEVLKNAVIELKRLDQVIQTNANVNDIKNALQLIDLVKEANRRNLSRTLDKVIPNRFFSNDTLTTKKYLYNARLEELEAEAASKPSITESATQMMDAVGVLTGTVEEGEEEDDDEEEVPSSGPPNQATSLAQTQSQEASSGSQTATREASSTGVWGVDSAEGTANRSLNDTLSIESKYNSRGIGAKASRGPLFMQYAKGGKIGSQPVDITRGIHHVMIYSDVGDFVLVGNTRTQLLQSIEIPSNSRGGEQLVKRFDHPDYVPVYSPLINSIEIDLKDDNGRALEFEFGRVYVKLHFKKHNIDQHI